MNTNDTIAQIESFRRYPRPCCLCGLSGKFVGVFFPNDSRKFGAPDGKHRIIVYSLCGRCQKQKSVAELVENKFLADLQKMN